MPPAGPGRRAVGLAELFTGFLTIGLRGFGGVLPWARRMAVEERGWLDDAECTSLLGLCQVLPGPNVVNFSIAVGSRFGGAAGAAASFAGLIAAPLAIVLLLGVLADRYGELPELAHPIGALGAASAGLVWATALRMVAAHRRSPPALLVVAAGFAAVGLAHWPLLPVVLALAVLSLVLQHGQRR